MAEETVGKVRPVRSRRGGESQERAGLQGLVDAQRRAGAAAGRPDALAVFLEHGGEALGGGEGGVGDLVDAVEEEGHPGLPVAVAAHAVQEVVVGGAVLLEVQAQVEQRLAEGPGVTEQTRDQQAADAAVAVQEGVDALELNVGETGPLEGREAVALGVEKPLPSDHSFNGAKSSRIARGAETSVVLAVLRFHP
jgi:hypothetical protein